VATFEGGSEVITVRRLETCAHKKPVWGGGIEETKVLQEHIRGKKSGGARGKGNEERRSEKRRNNEEGGQSTDKARSNTSKVTN